MRVVEVLQTLAPWAALIVGVYLAWGDVQKRRAAKDQQERNKIVDEELRPYRHEREHLATVEDVIQRIAQENERLSARLIASEQAHEVERQRRMGLEAELSMLKRKKGCDESQ